MTRKLTNSMRSTWNSCHRKYKFSYVDLIKRNKTAEALSFGTAFHSMMEVYWAKMLPMDSEKLDGNVYVEDIICEIANKYALDNCDEYAAKTLLALFDGYVARYLQEDRQNYSCVCVEAEFNTPLLNPENGGAGQSKTFHLAGKIDGIIAKKADGSICILEHKTTSLDIDPASDYWLKLPIDGQVSGYYLGASSIGYKAESCLYDVIRKPTIKPSHSIPVLDENGLKVVVDAEGNRAYNKNGTPRQSEDASKGLFMQKRDETADEWFDRLSADIKNNLDKYFQRMEIYRSETDLEDYLFDMWSLSKELIEAERTGHFSRNPNGCAQYGTCEFFGVCTNCESIDDPLLFVKKEKANEEL